MPEKHSNILIITLGNTPQVVTETVWALVKAHHPPFRPDRIILATTLAGRAQCRDALLGADGKLGHLCAELGMPLPQIDIAVPVNADGSECADIRTEAEAIAFGDLMVSLLQNCQAENRRVHVSLAGGRKTMSYFAGAALFYLGRPGDELSHVLVEPQAYEAPRSDFWWPDETRYPGARVQLARIPFWPMDQSAASQIFEAGRIGFAEIVRRMADAARTGVLEVDCLDRVIRYKGCVARLRDTSFALFRLYAAARKGEIDGRSLGAGMGSGWLSSDDILSGLLPVLQTYYGEATGRPGSSLEPWDRERLKDAKFHIGEAIGKQFGNSIAAREIGIADARTGRPRLSALALPASAIRIIPEA